MAPTPLTNSKLAMQLVEGSLAYIAGRVQGQMPIIPIEVTAIERASAGLTGAGQAWMYPLNDSGVFIDMSGATATIWFIGGDYDRALEALEALLKSGHRAKQLKDEAMAEPKQRARSFEVDLGNARLAHVIAEYSERGAQRERFRVRVIAQVRKN